MIRVDVISGLNGQAASWREEWDADGWRVNAMCGLEIYKNHRNLDGGTFTKTVVVYAPHTWRSVCPAPEEKRVAQAGKK